MRRLGAIVVFGVWWPIALVSGSAESRSAVQRAMPDIPTVASPRGIWDGVFTDAEAVRGEAVFLAHCGECHDDVGEAPSLTAGTFLRNWEGHTLARLHAKIRGEMPPGSVESVSPSEKLDVLAYILAQNGFPSGQEPLKAALDAFEKIHIVPRGGAAPLRTGAMVQVVGCLTSGEDHTWLLTKGTDPVAAALDRQAVEDSAAVAALPFGTKTVRLLNVFPSPERYAGNRLEVKGFLIREGADDIAVNVVTLRPVAPSCP